MCSGVLGVGSEVGRGWGTGCGPGGYGVVGGGGASGCRGCRGPEGTAQWLARGPPKAVLAASNIYF